MNKFSLGKLNSLVYLQGYKDNPTLYAFLEINGHQGTDISRGDGTPIPAYYDGDIVHIQDDCIVYLTDPDENRVCLEVSIAHGNNHQVKVGDRVKKGQIICNQSTVGSSVGWGDFDRLAWSHEHIAIRQAKRIDAKVQQKLIWNYRNDSPINYVIIGEEGGMDYFIDPNLYNNRALYQFAKAIQTTEGFYPGSIAYRLNNPGNIRDLNNKFIVYKTYNEGFYALCNYIERAITGNHYAYMKWGKGMTIVQFCSTYSPKSDGNDPVKKAKDIVQLVGLKDINQHMSDILLTEIEYVKKWSNLSQGLVPHIKEKVVTEENKIEDMKVQMNFINKFVLYLFNKFFKQ